MAARFLTTRLQRSGYKFLVRRQEQAFIRRDVRGLANPLSAQNSAVSIGVFLIGLSLVIGLLISILKPRPDRSFNSIITTQSGGMYVMYGGSPDSPEARLHPVTNLASARLIVGNPDDASVVKDATLEKIPRGPLMGIPSAPNNLSAHSQDPATWTVCDHRDSKSDLSLTTVGQVSTTLIAGKDMLDTHAHELGANQAILVRSSTSPDTLWLVYGDHRAEIGRQDYATHSALGLTPSKIDSAIVLTGSLVDAIDVYPTLTIPFLDNRGRVSSAVPGHVIGDILTLGDSKGGRDSYVVADGGVQRVTSVIASLLVNTGSRQTVEVNPDKVTTLPEVQVIDLNRYPDRIPDIIKPATVCFSWSKGRQDTTAQTRILTGDAVPMNPDKRDEVVSLLKPGKGVTQANVSLMEPGKGWYVRVTGSSVSSVSAEQLLYLDDTGTRYFISPDSKGSYDPVVGALGLNWQIPMPIPWSICKLYMQGSTLSQEAALIQHGFIPPNEHGVPAPAKPGTVSDPADKH